jgi:hypothetical protein
VLCDRQSHNVDHTRDSIVQIHHFLQLVGMKTQFKENEMKRILVIMCLLLKMPLSILCIRHETLCLVILSEMGMS